MQIVLYLDCIGGEDLLKFEALMEDMDMLPSCLFPSTPPMSAGLGDVYTGKWETFPHCLTGTNIPGVFRPVYQRAVGPLGDNTGLVPRINTNYLWQTLADLPYTEAEAIKFSHVAEQGCALSHEDNGFMGCTTSQI